MNHSHDRNAQQYLRQQIEQAGPVEQVLMLFDGAMRFLTQAKAAIERGDIEARCNANRRAMEIVAHLVGMVDPEKGGDAGKTLFGIYSSMLRRMPQVDFENSIAICEEVIANLRALRVGMAQGLAAQQQAKAPGAAQAGTVVAAPSSGAETALPGTRRNAVA